MPTSEEFMSSARKAHEKGDKVAAQRFIQMARRQQAQPASFVDKLKSNLMAGPGFVEAGLNMASGSIAAPIGGLAGIGATAANAMGLTDKLPGDVVHDVAGALTYQPISDAGKTISGAVQKPFELLADAGDASGQYVVDKTKGTFLEKAGPALGTTLSTAMQAGPILAMHKGGKALQTMTANKATNLQGKQWNTLERDKSIAEFQKLGFKLPPAAANPTMTNRLLTAVAGNSPLNKTIANQNLGRLTDIAKEHIGGNARMELTPELVASAKEAGLEHYKAIEQLPGVFVANNAFVAALDKLETGHLSAARSDFPEHFRDNADLSNLRQKIDKPMMSPSGAIQMMTRLDQESKLEYAAADTPAKLDMATAKSQGARALENLIKDSLEARGVPELYQGLVKGRELMAKASDVEAILDPALNAVDPNKLGALQRSGQPISGDLGTAAKMINQYTKASMRAQKIEGNPYTSTDLGLGLGGFALMHDPMGLLAAAVRPVTRALMTSKVGQKALVAPSKYQISPARQAIIDAMLKREVPLAIGSQQAREK